MIESDKLVAAIAKCIDDLPKILGEHWAEIERELTVLLRLLDSNKTNTGLIQDRIISLFSQQPGAIKKLENHYPELTREPHTTISAREFKSLLDNRPFAAVSRGRTSRASPDDPRPGPPGSATVSTPTESAKAERYTAVPVYFGTDREPTTGADDDEHFSGLRSGNEDLIFGKALVSIPDDHKMGELEKPKRWKLQFRADPNKHVVLLSVDTLSEESFRSGVLDDVRNAEKKESLVFIHGYNTSFNDAILRTAQVAYDLHFGGLAFAYSWPSEGEVKSYTVDENNIRWSQPHFKLFLHMLVTEFGLESVNVIAHSMGSRALAEIIPSFRADSLPADAAQINEVIFAAPDIDASTFKKLAAQYEKCANRVTLYASSNDKALKASKKVHRYARAGSSGEELVLLDGLDTIDASMIDTGLLGHSYYGDNRSVLSDLFHLIRNGHGPEERHLLQRNKAGVTYWAFKG